MKNFIYRLQYILAMFFIKIILLFPERLRFKFGDFLGGVGYRFLKKRREITRLNLNMALPEKSKEEIEKIGKESFKVMIKGFLCTLWLKEYLDEGKAKTEDRDVVDRAYNQGKGVIAALMHMGNMEATLGASRGYDVVTVAKKQRNPYLNEFIAKSRKEDLGLTVYTKSKSTSKELIKRLNNKEIFALFSDHRDKGAVVDFFGTPAKAPTGAVSLALKYDIPLILGYNYFNSDNSCTVKVREINLVKSGNFKEDVLNNTQLLIKVMEEVIREHPEQWMWFHDRWNLYREYEKKRK